MADLDMTLNTDDWFEMLSEVNLIIKSPELVTDVLFGCVLTDDLSGKFL